MPIWRVYIETLGGKWLELLSPMRMTAYNPLEFIITADTGHLKLVFECTECGREDFIEVKL
jgi:hypothetical protein